MKHKRFVMPVASIGCLADHGLVLKVTCGCGNERTFATSDLIKFVRTSLGPGAAPEDYALTYATRRMRCSGCGNRNVTCEAVAAHAV